MTLRDIALFFGTHGCDSKMNLLAGYQEGWILVTFFFVVFMDRVESGSISMEKSGKSISSLEGHKKGFIKHYFLEGQDNGTLPTHQLQCRV